MESGSNSIDAFLHSLGLYLRSERYDVMAELRSENYLNGDTTYFLHCYIEQEVNQNELIGKIPTHHLFYHGIQKATFSNTTLEDTCGKVKKSLYAFSLIKHHVLQEQILDPNDALVSIKLGNKNDDPRGNVTYQAGGSILSRLMLENQRGI